jgi:hypothetical protein
MWPHAERSEAHRRQRGARFILLGRYRVEVSAQRFQRRAFLLDLVSRSESHAAQDRYRRTPTLYRVLKHKRRYECRKRKPPAISGGAEYNTSERMRSPQRLARCPIPRGALGADAE